MTAPVPESPAARLEGSCAVSGRDWLRFAPAGPGPERVEAFFGGHAFDRHRHDTYALGITLAGVQRFDYRGAEANSLTGDLIVIHPDEIHNGRAGAASGFRYRMAYVEPRLVRDALGREAGALPFVRQAVVGEARLRAAFVRLLRDLDRPLEPIEADELLAETASALLAFDPGAARRRPGAACGLAVERARAFLDAHLDRTVASEELEGVTGLDRFELARHFRRGLGTSPYRYLTMRRLDRARDLIRSGLPLVEAASASGFADQSHMTRQFKAAFGLAPGRWRAMQGSVERRPFSGASPRRRSPP